METKLRKLEPEEQLSSFEKILLMTGHINLIASNVQNVLDARNESIFYKKSKNEDTEFHQGLANDTKELLDETAADLYKIYEDLVDFCNNCDAVSESDIQLGEPVFNLMHDSIEVDSETEE